MDVVHLNRLWQIALLFVVFNAFQWVKDNTIAPRYIGNVIGLHPVMIFIAIMIGARLDGIVGIIFALPVACVINVVVAHLTGKTDRLLTREQRTVRITKIPDKQAQT
jgi:predicted PurR-regulated permease PerM